MTRALTGRIVATGVLVTTGPLHVGGRWGEGGVDLALARNGAGDWYVPGTSLAGPMRAWAERLGPGVAERLFGPAHVRGADNGAASLVFVEDAPVAANGGGAPVSEIRDGVGIDRRTGAASNRVKFDRAVLPAGSTLPLHLTVELPVGADGAWVHAAVGHLVDALVSGEIGFGAARTRGGGGARLEAVKVVHQTFDRQGILAVLTARAGGEAIGGVPTSVLELKAAAPDLVPAVLPSVTISVAWAPVGPLMVRAGVDGLAVDSLPLVTSSPGGTRPVLPGSSVKGALRSRAERLVRTVRQEATGPDDDHKKQLAVELVEDLFGMAPQEERPRDAGSGPLPGKGALGVADCVATAIDADRWAKFCAAASVSDAVAALDAAKLDGWAVAHHVGIDRWTGGAADRLLYTSLEPGLVQWEPLHIQIDLSRIAEHRRRAAVALALLVVGDLGQGWIPLGFATNRGFGSLHVTRVSVASRGFDPELAMNVEGGDVLAALEPAVRERLATDWATEVLS